MKIAAGRLCVLPLSIILCILFLCHILSDIQRDCHEDNDTDCNVLCICPPGAKHKCTERRDIPGSVAFVPSVVGLIIAGEVLKDLAQIQR